MTGLAYVLVAALAVLVALLLGAQVELFRSVAQLREYAGLIDRPAEVELGAARGATPSSIGLPASLDAASAAVVLFLSDKCATCRSIAGALEGHVPAGALLVITSGGDPDEPPALGLDLDPARTVLDPAGSVMERLGAKVTPLGVMVRDGRLDRATTVPSTRQFYTLLESTRPFTAEPLVRGKHGGAS